MTKRGNIVRVTLFSLCLGTAVLGGVVIWTLGSRVQSIKTAEQSDPLWITSQLQFELLRFEADLTDYIFGSKSDEEVVERFDILWSRANVMKSGKLARLLEDIGVDTIPLEEFEATLGRVDPLVQSLPGRSAQETDRRLAAQELLAETKQFKSKFRVLSLEIAQAKSRLMLEFRTGLVSLSNAIAYLGIVIFVLIGVVVSILIIDVRSSRRRTHLLEQLVVEAKASAKMKDNFMSVVSHELRTPLTSILGGIAILKTKYGEKLDDGAKKMVDIAQRNAERLLSLVSDILDAHSLEEGKVSISKERLNLNSILISTVEECEIYASQLDVTISLKSSDDELILDGDRVRISQILSNFLSNAAKFSLPGGTVEVEARRKGRWIQTEIIDHGHGVPLDQQSNLFSRFHQVNPGTTGAHKSSGLGLSIAKQLIEMHGGKVGFTSVEGKGSTFWFSLPSATDTETDRIDRAPEIEKEPHRMGKRISIASLG